jgi:hypothetical protein
VLIPNPYSLPANICLDSLSCLNALDLEGTSRTRVVDPNARCRRWRSLSVGDTKRDVSPDGNRLRTRLRLQRDLGRCLLRLR